MKKTIFSFLLLINCAFAQVKNGEAVSDIDFATVLNAPVRNIRLSQLKGKVVLVEFWATWCGSCLEAMPHLKQLQERYPERLQVIAVTEETEKRTGQYLLSRPSNLWFAVDTAGVIGALFPHQLIPHTVLISPDGRLIANTDPAGVIAEVIDSVLANKEVHLTEKKDNLLTYEELIKDNFFASDTVKYRFMIQPEIKGAPSLSTTYIRDEVFDGRRITAINLPILALYRVAYGGWPYGRMVDKTHVSDKASGHNKEPGYCLDIIVENKRVLLPALKKELLSRFEVQARIEKQRKEVYVLTIADAERFKKIPVDTSGVRTYYARHGEIDQQSMTMADLAEYLESYGTGRLPVVDETYCDKRFDIKFTFQPEDPASLTRILADMGLRLEKGQREIDMLVLYK